jgi:hypothetical protein
MGSARLRILCESIVEELDNALSGVEWADNPELFESIRNAKDNANQIIYCLDETPDELNFE